MYSAPVIELFLFMLDVSQNNIEYKMVNKMVG